MKYARIGIPCTLIRLGCDSENKMIIRNSNDISVITFFNMQKPY